MKTKNDPTPNLSFRGSTTKNKATLLAKTLIRLLFVSLLASLLPAASAHAMPIQDHTASRASSSLARATEPAEPDAQELFDDRVGIRALAPAAPQARTYGAYFPYEYTTQTGQQLTFFNVYTGTHTLTINIYNPNGSFNRTRSLTLRAYETITIDDPKTTWGLNVAPSNGSPATDTAYGIIATSSRPFGLVAATDATEFGGSGYSSVNPQSEPYTDTWFGMWNIDAGQGCSDPPTAEDYVFVFNPNNAATNVTFDVYDTNGNVIDANGSAAGTSQTVAFSAYQTQKIYPQCDLNVTAAQQNIGIHLTSDKGVVITIKTHLGTEYNAGWLKHDVVSGTYVPFPTPKNATYWIWENGGTAGADANIAAVRVTNIVNATNNVTWRIYPFDKSGPVGGDHYEITQAVPPYGTVEMPLPNGMRTETVNNPYFHYYEVESDYPIAPLVSYDTNIEMPPPGRVTSYWWGLKDPSRTGTIFLVNPNDVPITIKTDAWNWTGGSPQVEPGQDIVMQPKSAHVTTPSDTTVNQGPGFNSLNNKVVHFYTEPRIPFAVHLQEPTYGDVNPLFEAGAQFEPSNTQSACPGAAVTLNYAHVVTNIGTLPDNFYLEAVSSQNWTNRIYADNGAGTSCDGSLTPAELAAGVITVTPELAPEASFCLVVQVDVPASAPAGTVDVTTVTATSVNDATAWGSVTDTTTLYDYNPAISVTKSGPASASVGDTVTYTFNVINDNVSGDGSAITGVSVSDDVAGAAIYVSGDDGNIGELEVGETWVYNKTYTVADSDPDPLVNTATASGADLCAAPIVSSVDSHSLDVLRPELRMDKDTSTPTVVAGGQATYQIVVANNGDSAATGVTVADTLPAGFTYASSSVVETGATRTATSDPTVGDNLLAFGAWEISPGGQIAITVAVDVSTGITPGTYDNTASASAAHHPTIDDDGLVANDADTLATDTPEADEDVRVETPRLGVAKRLVSAPAYNGNGTFDVTYEILVQNVGTTALSNIQVTDDLAATFAGATSFAVIGVSSATFTTNATYEGVSDKNLLTGADTLATLAEGTITLVVRVTPGGNPGPYDNTAIGSGQDPFGRTISDTSTDGNDTDPDTVGLTAPADNPNPGDNSVPTPVLFDLPASYTVTKTLVTAGDVRVGGEVVFSIHIENTGLRPITVLPLQDIYDTTYLAYGFGTLYSTPASDNTDDDGTIEWADLTVSFGKDLGLGESFEVNVIFTGKADTTALTPDGKTPNTATVQGALAGSVSLPQQSGEARVRILDPTGVTLAGFTASAARSDVLLSWQTVSESGFVGFNLLRQGGGAAGLVTLNATLIAAQHAGQDRGAAYAFRDEGLQPGAYTYYLEVINLDGSPELLGTIEISTPLTGGNFSFSRHGSILF